MTEPTATIHRAVPSNDSNTRALASVIVTPINDLVASREQEAAADEFAELLTALADLAVGARRQRERLLGLSSAGDARVRRAVEHLSDLERHAYEVGVEAARVRHELQHARLI
ncbi:MAG: hypothetical protein QOF77_1939 [Solirubrobacteraceae bacterium]|jgi:hypothetical protein|nr:hypothetical protein [Solirubrobacteraceae bacterium]